MFRQRMSLSDEEYTSECSFEEREPRWDFRRANQVYGDSETDEDEDEDEDPLPPTAAFSAAGLDSSIRICKDYNAMGICYKASCYSMHICYSYVINRRKCQNINCSLNHDIFEDSCKMLLQMAQISVNGSPSDVLDAIAKGMNSSGESNNKHKTPDNSQSYKNRTTNVWPQHVEDDRLNRDNSRQMKDTRIMRELSSSDSSESSSSEDDQDASSSQHITGQRSIGTTNKESRKCVYKSQAQSPNRYETKWSSDSDGNVGIPEICYYSVEERCKYDRSGCPKLHSDQHYHWQVNHRAFNNHYNWINLGPQLSDNIEHLYCQPGQECESLPPLDSQSKNKLKGIFDTDTLRIDFLNMTLTSPNITPLHLRRLCTEQIYYQQIPSNIFVWYFKDGNGIWISYGNSDSAGVQSLASQIDSEDIEKMHQQGNATITFQNSRYNYTINFKQMIQINQETNTNRDVRRRPMLHFKGKLGPSSPKQISSAIIQHQVNAPKTKWSHELIGTVEVPEICYDSVKKACRNENTGCKRLHSTNYFHWQVSVNGNIWYNFLKSHSETIEKEFCDVNNQIMQLKPLNPSELTSLNQKLLSVLGKGTLIIDFKDMTARVSSSKVLNLRRLCSEFIAGNDVRENTFIWHFKDKNDRWIAYGEADSAGVASLATNCSSNDIEREYNMKSKTMTMKNSRYTFTIDFGLMKQINLETKTQREIQRRPKQYNVNPNLPLQRWASMPKNLPLKHQASSPTNPLLQQGASKPTNFPIKHKASTPTNLPLQHWAPMPNNHKKGFVRVDIPSISNEYQKVIGIIKGGIPNIMKIERIQNKYLWIALENKISEMTEIYNGNVTTVNVQQLFHGTSAAVIDAICAENFDPRLHGSAAGQREGQGAYFSPFANFSNRYSKPDASGNKYLFVARVAIGSKVRGSPNMSRPPINQATGRPYDSTVDNVNNTKIIVKYDKQEFYPEYLITYS